jgi:hypothetical protein
LFVAKIHCLLQEYAYLMCALMLLAKLGVSGVPDGPLATCPACAKAGSVQLMIDFNFGLSHLDKCGSSSVRRPPPNQLLFVQDSQMEELLAGDIAEADADKGCSDFGAATAIGRTDEKVC